MAELRYVGQTSPGQSPVGGISTAGGSLFSLLFGVQIGNDTSNNFALSINGLAVRTPCGRYVAKERHHDRLMDVTALLLPMNPMVVRMPVKPSQVRSGDVIVTSDPPDFSAIYVLDRRESGWIYGLDTGTSQVTEFALPRNPLVNFYVVAVSLFDVLTRKSFLKRHA